MAEPVVHTERYAERVQMLGDANHAAVRKKGALAVLQMRYNVHHGRRAVRVGAVVGGIAIKHLH